MNTQPKKKTTVRKSYKVAFIALMGLVYFTYHFPTSVQHADFMTLTADGTFGFLIGIVLVTAYDLFREDL